MNRKFEAVKFLALMATMAIFFSCEDKVDMLQNHPVDFSEVEIEDIFWKPRLTRHATVTVPFCLDQCTKQTHRVDNFAVAAGLEDGKFQGLFYDDSDLYKMIEGASYSLQNTPNEELEAKLDSIIQIVAAAQQKDGYINTYFTLEKPGMQWTDMDKHEMYCGGHLIEAAIAHKKATGKEDLMNVAIRFADYLVDRFGINKQVWVPGHPEIELALIKLYHETGNRDYLDLSHFLLEQRGHGRADWRAHSYYIDEKPVSELEKISGHAVRAMYLFTGMADYSATSGDQSYLAALDRLWENVVNAKMYVTGGIGSSRHNEGFTEDYDLPNKEAYCETCASVGMVMWNQRMNMLKGQGKYTDILERSMYNGALAGVSLSSDRFFYVNPLSSDGSHHRRPWYGTACCPSQISRFLPSIGGYIYATSTEDLWVNLYIGSTAEVKVGRNIVKVAQRTDYPWNGKVSLFLTPEKPCEIGVKMRIPSWCDKWVAYVNDQCWSSYEKGKLWTMDPTSTTLDEGYLRIQKLWNEDDKIELYMNMPVEMVSADPRVKANVGRRAIQRGPLVYCVEETDNPQMDEIKLSNDTQFNVSWEGETLGGVMVIKAKEDGKEWKLIPYYGWDNRAPGKMEVWLKYDSRDVRPNKYTSLPLGTVKAEGWLKEMLHRQRDGITSKMDQVYESVMGSRNGWLGGDGDQWERGPYWIDGLLPMAYILNDEELKAKAQPWVEWALASQREDGFFGPDQDYSYERGLQRNNSHDWWPRMVVLKVLQQYYSATDDERVISFLKKYFKYQLTTLPEKPLGYWTSWAEYRVCDNLNVVLWLYDQIHEEWLLDLADMLHEQGYDFTNMFLNTDYLKNNCTIHCVNLAQGIKEPIIYWRVDPQQKYISAVHKAFDDIRQYNGFPNGMFGGDELLHGNVPTQGSELCSAVELMYSLEEMIKVTGDLGFVEHLERIVFNALPTQITDDFTGKQYFQQPNQVKIARNYYNFDISHGQTDLVYGLLTGYPCCTSNLHQGWPKFTHNLWLGTSDGGLAALAYSPSSVKKTIMGVDIEIKEITNYPMEGKIRFELSMDSSKSVRFPIHLRIPSWTFDPVLKLNGHFADVSGTLVPGSVVVLREKWRDGDVIELELPMKVTHQRWYENAVSVERGPLVYALKIKEKWEKHQFTKESESIYGDNYWEVLPLSPWNYGLMADKIGKQEEFKVAVDDRKLKSDWYWNLESCPITIKTTGKQIPIWKLYNDMAGPIPYSSSFYPYDFKDIDEETIELIPYGCTTLRISEFPVLR